MIILLSILTAIAFAAVMLYWYPEASRVWFQRIVFARAVIFLVLGIVVAIVFIGTGYWPLVLLGFATLVLMAMGGILYVQDEPVSVIPR